MILAIDTGNTNIVLGCIENRKIHAVARMATDVNKTDCEYAVGIKEVLAFAGFRPEDFEGAILSSVVWPLTSTLCRAVKLLTGLDTLVVGKGLKTGLDIRLDDPGQIGADLVVGAVAALHLHRPPLIVIDMGTATTISAIDAQGRFAGGAIVPGLRLSMESLSGHTSQLPRVSLDAPAKCIGTNTVACMQSGAIYGSAALLDGMIERMEAELGAPAAVILAIASFIAIGTKTGFGAVTNYVPGEAQLTFAAGSTSIVGAWIFGCIVTPDVTRYAKNGKHVAIAAPIAVYVGLAMIELVGAMTAQATGNASFVAATAALGLGILVFVCAIFCVWTTQDNNIYSASLSLQNIFVDTKLEGKVKHAVLAVIVAVLAAVFAAAGAVKYLLPIIKALSVLLPPIPAMMIAEQWCVKNSKENQTINWVGLLAWAISTTIGQICINHNFLIPAVVSMVVAFFLYWGLSKALDKSWNKEATGKAE